MKSNSSQEVMVAEESFKPNLSERYQKKFSELILKLKSSLPTNRIQIIDDALHKPDVCQIQKVFSLYESYEKSKEEASGRISCLEKIDISSASGSIEITVEFSEQADENNIYDCLTEVFCGNENILKQLFIIRRHGWKLTKKDSKKIQVDQEQPVIKAVTGNIHSELRFSVGCKELQLEKFNQNRKIAINSEKEKLLLIDAEEIKLSKEIMGKPDFDSLRNEFIEFHKYMSVLNILKDLSKQGWSFQYKDNGLQLVMEEGELSDKDHIRYRLSAERNAQFDDVHVKNFIKRMETPRGYQGDQISIINLIGDKEVILKKIDAGERVCEPYIQLVTREKDQFTGIYLSDIWRYFRYTWAIPYKTMPGRNLFYLVRDRAQKYHPVIGIFALGNSVLNLSVRDDDIGWTVNSIRKNMQRKASVSFCDQTVSGTDGKKVKAKITHYDESESDFTRRTAEYADIIFPLLENNIRRSIDELYTRDLNYYRQTKYPKQEFIDHLMDVATKEGQRSINNKNNERNPDWIEETQKPLFKKKRATELAKLLKAKKTINEAPAGTNVDKIKYLLSFESGRQAISTALIANRKCKIGSNMMDIIVCGSIPPYNELLGGKLVSILACSPQVIRDYTEKYANQISEIASRMKGKEVIRDSHLAYLGTTSLYAVGSSQYNRIKVPLKTGGILEYRKMGITEGYGTVYYSKETTKNLSKLMELMDGGKKINHVFGEGTSPRFRMMSKGFSILGIRADGFLQHHTPRIVYSINLAKNTNSFLLGIDDKLDYGFDLSNEQDVQMHTQELIDYWYKRWLEMRLHSVNIKERLEIFDLDAFLLGNKC